MKRRFVGDLHIHTCLSPCAEPDMTPKRIIDRALDRGMDIIAITDHNSAENLEAAASIAKRRGLTLLPSMEITSAEEAHVLAIFETVRTALEMQETVYKTLTGGVNDERLWGCQSVVDENDEVVRLNKRLLIGATGLALKALVEEIHALGGLAVASHVDRGSFSVISQLGYIPEDIEFDALETTGGAFKEGPHAHAAWISSSDAHRLDDIGKRTTAFLLKEASFREIAMALGGMGGRMISQN